MTTPNDVQNQINAVPWTNGKGMVTGATIMGLLTAIVGLFALYSELIQSQLPSPLHRPSLRYI